jgi:two-component system response regulator BaeR
MLKAFAADGDAVIDYLKQEKPELLLVGIVSPAHDNSAPERAPAAGNDVPVFMLTTQIDEIDRLLALQAGAGRNSLGKPCDRQEMIARLKALLQLLEANPATATREYLFTVDEERMNISYRDQVLDLTPREYQLLALLLSRPGRVFSRALLMERLHPDWDDVSDRSIDSHIKNLRKKLALPAAGRVVIHTIYGVGYRLDI